MNAVWPAHTTCRYGVCNRYGHACGAHPSPNQQGITAASQHDCLRLPGFKALTGMSQGGGFASLFEVAGVPFGTRLVAIAWFPVVDWDVLGWPISATCIRHVASSVQTGTWHNPTGPRYSPPGLTCRRLATTKLLKTCGTTPGSHRIKKPGRNRASKGGDLSLD